MTLLVPYLSALLVTIGASLSSAFLPKHDLAVRKPMNTLYALTERQMQFWEDVDEGLDDIENFFVKKGQDIDRIRQFVKR